jgi:hypothetical protein
MKNDVCKHDITVMIQSPVLIEIGLRCKFVYIPIKICKLVLFVCFAVGFQNVFRTWNPQCFLSTVFLTISYLFWNPYSISHYRSLKRRFWCKETKGEMALKTVSVDRKSRKYCSKCYCKFRWICICLQRGTPKKIDHWQRTENIEEFISKESHRTTVKVYN